MFLSYSLNPLSFKGLIYIVNLKYFWWDLGGSGINGPGVGTPCTPLHRSRCDGWFRVEYYPP